MSANVCRWEIEYLAHPVLRKAVISRQVGNEQAQETEESEVGASIEQADPRQAQQGRSGAAVTVAVGNVMNPIYLGDGVYAYFNGSGIELRLGSHENECAVYLEPEVLDKLIEWSAKVRTQSRVA